MNKALTYLFSICALLLITSFAYGATYPMPRNGDIIGQLFTIQVEKGDSMERIAHRYELSLHELLEANPHVNARQLHPGQTLLIPTQFILPKYRQGIVINLPELRLYYFTPDGKYVKTYPVGLGRREWRTPTTTTVVVDKRIDPDWHVPDSIRDHVWEKYGKLLPEVVPGGTPKNPLGHRAIYLGKRGYLIHGTNQPHLIGKYVSSGCIRMKNESVEELYELVSNGIPVHITNHSQKAGWYNNTLFLESHIPVNLPEQETNKLNNDSPDLAIRDAINGHTANVNWAEADNVAEERLGVPKPIGSGISTLITHQSSKWIRK